MVTINWFAAIFKSKTIKWDYTRYGSGKMCFSPAELLLLCVFVFVRCRFQALIRYISPAELY